MKKISILIILFGCIFALFGCNSLQDSNNSYKLKVVDNWNLLVHPLEEEYEAGSKIEVHLHFRSGVSVGIKVNDGLLIAKDYASDLCQSVSFIMPNSDTIIHTHQNGYIINSCINDNHTWDEGKIIQVPGGKEQIQYICSLCGEAKIEDINNDNISNVYLASHVANNGYYDVSSITLDEENKTFTYYFAVISSYIGHGTYEYKDGYLILESSIDDQTWVFKVVDKALVFDLSLSDGHLWFIPVPEETAQLIYFLKDITIEEKINTTLKISDDLRPMSSNDKIYTSYVKDYGLATAFILYGDAGVVWDEVIEDVKFTYYDSGRIYIYYNGLIYTLTEAYESSILTLEDLTNLLQICLQKENFDNIPLKTEIYFGPYPSWGDEFEEFFKEFNLFNSNYMINDYESYINVYSKIPNLELELYDEEWANEFFNNNLLIVMGRCISGSTDYVPVNYYYNTDSNEIIFKYKNQIGDAVCDVFIGYSIDIITLPKDIKDSTQVAKIVTDYEQKEKEKIAELKKTEPEMIYYFNPIDRVRCTFVFEDSDSVNRIIEEYDVYNVFKDADINNFDSIKMLMIIFERDNFTEGIYQKINQIKDNETSVKELYINFESVYIESYMPNIDYYINEKVELNYEIEKKLFNLTWEKGFIIRSKEEYDAYLDYLLEIEDFEPIRENINSKKDLYDETFFEENALIISSLITRGSGSIKLTLDNLYISDNKVYIVVRTDEPAVGTADIQEATFAFIVKQSDILNVNEVVTLE